MPSLPATTARVLTGGRNRQRGSDRRQGDRTGRISRDELARRQDALSRTPLFAGLSRRHLRALARVTAISSYREGATIVREGAAGGSLFVILEGRAKVTAKGRTLARIAEGDFFGEMSLLDGSPRSASVIAETRMTVLRLSGRDFTRVLKADPSIGWILLTELAGRLRQRERGLR